MVAQCVDVGGGVGGWARVGEDKGIEVLIYERGEGGEGNGTVLVGGR